MFPKILPVSSQAVSFNVRPAKGICNPVRNIRCQSSANVSDGVANPGKGTSYFITCNCCANNAVLLYFFAAPPDSKGLSAWEDMS